MERIVPQLPGLSRRKESFLRGLGRKSVRDRRKRFLAEGVRVVEAALSSPLRVTDIVGTASAAPDIERWRREDRLAGIDVALTDERTFRELSESVHPQGVLAVVEEPAAALEDLVADGPVLVLDRLQDPGNAGTLLRTLQAVGGGTVLALLGTVDLYNAKVVRASAGSLFHLRVAMRVSAAEAVDWLAARGVSLLALDRRGSSLFQTDWPTTERPALAVGNEGAGIEPLLRERAAAVLALPMEEGVDSLNAGVAGSIALYEWRRRRGSS